MLKKQLKVGSFVVYPSHGVGKLIAREVSEISGCKVELYVIHFDRDRMTLRLPVHKAKTAGLREVSSPENMKKALDILTTKIRIRRTMWSRRVQEYETKINSGNPESIAEVVRELFRLQPGTDQSYSERQIYQAAMVRLASEFAAVEHINESEAVEKMEEILRAA